MRLFLIDSQLPAALVPWLEAKGYRAMHVLPLGLAQAPDESIWQRAARERAVILSKDEDFARLSMMRPEPVPVVWLRLGNCRTLALLGVLERTWPLVEEQLQRGSRLIEVL